MNYGNPWGFNPNMVQVIPASSMEEINGYPLSVGQSVIFQSTDGQYLFIKSCPAVGQTKVDTFLHQEPPPPPPSPEMLAIAELQKQLAQLMEQKKGENDNV